MTRQPRRRSHADAAPGWVAGQVPSISASGIGTQFRHDRGPKSLDTDQGVVAV